MTDIWTIFGIGLLTSIFTLVLKSIKPELALLVELGGMATISILLMGGFLSLKSAVLSIFQTDVLNFDFLNLTFKSIGICFITSFASSICKDFGQTALSATVETAGKIIIVILSLPMVKSITQTALELIG